MSDYYLPPSDPATSPLPAIPTWHLLLFRTLFVYVLNALANTVSMYTCLHTESSMAQEGESSSGCSTPDVVDYLKYKEYQLQRKEEDLLRKEKKSQEQE